MRSSCEMFWRNWSSHAASLERVGVLLLELHVRRRERGVGAFEILNETRLLGRRRHLICHHSDEMPRVATHGIGRREVERDRAEHRARRLQRQRDERAEAELLGDLSPVGERRILEHVEHFDRASLGGREAARTVTEPHAHLVEKLRVSAGPVVDRGQPHQVRAFVDDVDAAERRADERAHAIERELKNLFRALGGDERVDDLASGHQLAQPDVAIGCLTTETLGRRRHWRRHD